MIIAIPSKGRPTIVNTAGIFKGIDEAMMFVPENEKRDYENNQQVKIVGVPSAMNGITKTRNWILEFAKGDDVVFLDDDAKTTGVVVSVGMNMRSIKKKEGQFWVGEFEKIFASAYGIGARIWGMKTEAAARSNYTYWPFRTASYVTASCMGILGDSNLKFDESFPVKEDYELCLRCLKEDGLILSAQYLVWENDHWFKDGGCKAYRTGKMELDCIRRLMKMYPGLVRENKGNKQDYTIKIL